MNPDDYAEWNDALNVIAESGGPVMILGGVDAGKTTFARLLASVVTRSGRVAAIIDSDLGQSEIGPPACVGLGLLSNSGMDLSNLTPTGLDFVGSTMSRGCMLEHVVAVRRMADIALDRSPHVVILDTTGFISGQPALRLKQAKADLISPDHIVAIQRKDECERILSVLHADSTRTIHRLAVPQVIGRKTAAFRAQRRAARFAAYFQESEIRQISFERVAFSHTWLNSVPPAPPHICKFLSDAAGTKVLYAEHGSRFLGMVTESPSTKDLSLIHEQFKPQAIAITPVQLFNQLLVGLSDGSRLLGLGIVLEVDFTRRVLQVQTPVRSIPNVRLVHFGIMRVRPDGKELGFLKPGDL